MARKKMILDLDTGIDDTLAIAYALGSPEVDLIGITGTYGNVTVSQGVANDLKILDVFGRPDIPVFVGKGHAVAKDSFEVLPISAFIHGANGIGEVELPEVSAQPAPQGAVDFLVDAVREHGEDLVIVATGPMTNLAHALRQDPEFARRANIVIMGGALTAPGNVNAWTEANISQDPEAADELFRSGARVTMVGLDVTLQTLLTYAHTKRWRQLGTPAGDFLADATDYYIKAYEETAPHLGGCGLHDPLAVAVAIDPSLITALPLRLKVDLEGPTRGRTIGDETRLSEREQCPTRAAVMVETERFVDEFMRRITDMAS